MEGMIGKTLGKYQIIEQLGEGGMATVYKAYDPSLERFVAIKVIRMVNQIDPLFLARFQREARALAKLDHPYILKVLDYGEENGTPYLVMPFVANGTLSEYARAKVPYDKAIGIIRKMAEALSYAHKRKIIHRDIKPANILFGESGEPVLSDFGIAKILDTGDQTQLTGTGLGIGTPAYMAPEQWNGIADERTDIYSLGIVLYELITSRVPYQAETPAAILLKQAQDPLPRPKNFTFDLPDAVEGLIFKALAKDPNLRYQTMDDFIHGMDAVMQNKTTVAAIPPQAINDQSATRIAYRPSSSNQVPIMVQKAPAPKRKWMPWAIGGGAVFVVGWILFLVIFGFSKLNHSAQNKQTGTSTSITQALNNPTSLAGNQNSTQIAPGGTVTQPETSPTFVSQQTSTTQSVSTIAKMPVDIPVFTPNNGDVITSESAGTLMFMYSTSGDPKVVKDFFLTNLKSQSWNLNNTTDMAAQNSTMYQFTKDSRSLMVNVMLEQDNKTYVQIVISQQTN